MAKPIAVQHTGELNDFQSVIGAETRWAASGRLPLKNPVGYRAYQRFGPGYSQRVPRRTEVGSTLTRELVTITE